jgi:very-short-patch-repair endonuclease
MSNYSDKVESMFKRAFPSYRIKKEKYILYQGIRLFYDFIVPEMKLLIEVQGQQHYSFNKLYHRDKEDLEKQKFNDTLKEEWASTNGYSLLSIKYDIIDSLTDSKFKTMVIDII